MRTKKCSARQLERVRSKLVRQGHCSDEWFTHTVLLAELFGRTSWDQHRAMIAEFHDRVGAGRLSFISSMDVGALILELQADSLQDPVMREFLYTEAQFRARWCAQGASTGGEGLARLVHVHRLAEKIATAKVEAAS